MLKEKGITLIALVITIIVLLILAGVTLATVTGYDGILPNAQKAVNQYKEGVGNDQEIINTINDLFEEYLTPQTPKETTTFTSENVKQHIGEYVDLRNNPLGLANNDTAHNWRILDVDSNGNLLLILADYLPNTNSCATSAGFTKLDGFDFYFHISVMPDEFVSILKNTTKWQGLVNGISGATATGSPTYEQMEASYLKKYGNSWDDDVDEGTWGNPKAMNDSLYVPRTGELTVFVSEHQSYSMPLRYDLASVERNPYTGIADGLAYVSSTGFIGYGEVPGAAEDDISWEGLDAIIRPVVSLPEGAQLTETNVSGVWTITK